jgi:hypothetical protein
MHYHAVVLLLHVDIHKCLHASTHTRAKRSVRSKTTRTLYVHIYTQQTHTFQSSHRKHRRPRQYMLTSRRRYVMLPKYNYLRPITVRALDFFYSLQLWNSLTSPAWSPNPLNISPQQLLLYACTGRTSTSREHRYLNDAVLHGTDIERNDGAFFLLPAEQKI